MAQHPIDFSSTERIVLLIDLHPLLHLTDPWPYLTPILSCAQTLLSFPPLSSSLFSFKLFFSSLFPLLSSSKLHPFLRTAATSLSFHHPPHTLSSLARALSSLSFLSDSLQSADSPPPPPRASLAATSLLQIVHDYAWDQAGLDPPGTLSDSPPLVRPNLVLLFSPIPRSSKCAAEFMNADDGILESGDAISAEVCANFGHVNNAFLRRDIHCCWVDAGYQWDRDEDKGATYFGNGIRKLGWGFSSTSSIVLGSALLPFGLIYPKIGALLSSIYCNSSCRSYHAQLNLEISDVNEMPLECHCCELDLIRLDEPPRHGHDDISLGARTEVGGCEPQQSFWGSISEGVTKLHVRGVQRYESCNNIDVGSSYSILVRSYGKEPVDSSSGFFADRVLEMLSTDSFEFFQRNAVPIWQILLSFLCREGYWALVSLSNGDGSSITGILKPLTIHSALVSILDKKVLLKNMEDCLGGQNLFQHAKGIVDKNHVEEHIDTQFKASLPKKHVALESHRTRRSKKQVLMHKDLSWASFCKEASENNQMVLEELYLSRQRKTSKRLRFLQCWMKQAKKFRCCSLTKPEDQPHEVIPVRLDDRCSLDEECENPISLSVSTGEDSFTESVQFAEGPESLPTLESSEAFFSSLNGKIHEALESDHVDLGALAYRLVKSSIHLLLQKYSIRSDSENQTPAVESDGSCDQMVSELTKVLLLEPKQLIAKHKASSPSFMLASKDIVREYELQIMFRMEILQSLAEASIIESIKKKFVKQICLLLEKIQCHLEGGFFGGKGLDEYVAKAIKNRYSHTIGDVVHEIYKTMDLLIFDSEDQLPNPLLNCEDSNQSWKQNEARAGRVEVGCSDAQRSAEDESSQPLGSTSGQFQTSTYVEHSRRLAEAQGKRERARRLASFTTWKPDLQRVWAPKQPMAMRAKPYPLPKLLKKKKCSQEGYDVVCETPMTEIKRSCRRNAAGTKEHGGSEFNSTGTVPKALFQDDQ